MPPKKRALEDADGNAQPPAKRNSTGSKNADAQQNTRDDEESASTPDLPVRPRDLWSLTPRRVTEMCRMTTSARKPPMNTFA